MVSAVAFAVGVLPPLASAPTVLSTAAVAATRPARPPLALPPPSGHLSRRCRWAAAPPPPPTAPAGNGLSMRSGAGGADGPTPSPPLPADDAESDEPNAAGSDGSGGGLDGGGGAFVVDMDALRQRLSSATAATRHQETPSP